MARSAAVGAGRVEAAPCTVGGGAVEASSASPRRSRVARARATLPALLLALPAVLVFGVFAWWPLVRGLVLAGQESRAGADPRWVGLDNVTYVLADPLVATAALNTLAYTGLALVVGFPLPVVLAVVLTELRRTRSLATTLVYLPVVMPPAVAVLLWRTLLDPADSGVLNTLLARVGVEPQPWLASTTTALPAVVVAATWASAGSAVVVYVAALSSVRTELYEAAELDGAGVLARVRHVTLPHLRGVLLVMLLLQLIGTAQAFTEPFLLTRGGPQRSTTTLLMVIREYAVVRGDLGAAAALGALLALSLVAVSVAYWRLTRRWGSA